NRSAYCRQPEMMPRCRRCYSPAPTRSSSEPARVHHPARRRGSVAARGARAAKRAMRRIGVLTGIGDDDFAQARFAVFAQALAQLGWIDGRNVRIDYRWGGGDIETIRKHATELAAAAPDAIFAYVWRDR